MSSTTRPLLSIGVLAALLAVTPPGFSAQVPGPPPGTNLDLPWTIGPDEGAPRHAPPPSNAQLRALGKSLYRSRCAQCHGEVGDGRGQVADRLNPKPTDFTKGVFKLRSTPAGALPTDLDLFRTLTRGMHGTAMFPWSRLSERERWALVYQLKSFSPRFRQEPVPAAITVPIAPRETDALKDHGEALYVRLGCGNCHGDSGAGDGVARERLRKAGDREARARDFTRGRFIRGAEMEDLYLTLKVGIDGTQMHAYPLSDNELWALAAYVRLLIHERPLPDFPPARTLGAGWNSKGR
jgi:cytochrome c oxidase cbb3-type subunit 2